jgi:hypothetical protein
MSDKGIIGLCILVFCILVFGPFLFIWSLNTLFGLGIEYSLSTWFAALVLCGSISARVSK